MGKVRILDLGTGSGCILISLLLSLPNAIGVGLDISSEAVKAAELNAQRHNVTDRALFCHGDFTEIHHGQLNSQLLAFTEQRPFDIIVSNPPYLSGKEYQRITNERPALLAEPRTAIIAGSSGLEMYEALLYSLDRCFSGYQHAHDGISGSSEDNVFGTGSLCRSSSLMDRNYSLSRILKKSGLGGGVLLTRSKSMKKPTIEVVSLNARGEEPDSPNSGMLSIPEVDLDMESASSGRSSPIETINLYEEEEEDAEMEEQEEKFEIISAFDEEMVINAPKAIPALRHASVIGHETLLVLECPPKRFDIVMADLFGSWTTVGVGRDQQGQRRCLMLQL